MSNKSEKINIEEKLESVSKELQIFKKASLKTTDKLDYEAKLTASKVRKIQKLADMVDESKLGKIMAENDARLAELSRKLQVEIEKNVVVSEVSRLYPDLAMKAIKLLDNDDSFWHGSSVQGRTIGEWVVLLGGEK